jgi:hypothetical protein
MWKIAVAVVLALAVTGCGGRAAWPAKPVGVSETCIDGVTYLQFPSGASVKYDADGHVVACK